MHTLWWTMVLGCRGDRRVDEADDAWARVMTELDDRAVGVRDAVVQGDLSRAKAEGRRLRGALPTELRKRDPQVPERLLAALDALDAAATPHEAADAVSELGVGCLQCHAETHASLAMREPRPVRPASGAVPAEMERHRAFVEAVWLGLIGGDDAALGQATALLDQGGLTAGTPVRRDPGFVLTPAAAAVDQRVHDLAARIRATPGDGRPPLFAELLGTCADCHALAKVRGALTTASAPPPNPAMNTHFLEMVKLELAVIGGDVDEARRAAEALEGAQIVASADAEPHVRALHEVAGRVKYMNQVPALAQGAAELLANCGRCHQATGGGPHAAVEPKPAGDAPEMARHLYASFWMGQSLLQADDAAWVAGAEVLDAQGLGPLVGEPAQDAAVHALGTRAIHATGPADRQVVFGELLATCSPCHARLPR